MRWYLSALGSRIYTPHRAVHLQFCWNSIHPPLLLKGVLWGRDKANLEIQLETEIEWTPRCIGRPWSSQFGDAIGDRDWVNWQLNWEAIIDLVWRCTWRPWSTEFGDALGGVDPVNLEMHSEAVIEQGCRCRGRLWSTKIGGILGGSGFGGRRDSSWDSIH